MTGESGSATFDVFDATAGDVVAVRVGAGTPAGYDGLYDPLARTTDEHGRVHVYEETPDWTLATYLSHLRGVVPDLRDGPRFDVGRYDAVVDSRWLRLLHYQWRAIAPVRPVTPEEVRSCELSERERTLAGCAAATTGERGSRTTGQNDSSASRSACSRDSAATQRTFVASP